ncbi:hypothetical protein TNCT_311721 [Trichonephila clavata]|uniref:Uncharacterized protein n=1 Tax=Trichonephila clavata TaxID=2740835 RepID=A0A8X6G8I1_TRICU|nr:hypothetical protein TNCT_311721 [Trichonephila clavata]
MEEPNVNSKRKADSPKTEVKTRRSDSASESEDKSAKRDSGNKPQKTRWGPPPSSASGTDEKMVSPNKEDEKSHLTRHLRITNMLDNKEKLVEHLFLTITGNALDELIPDYLKEYSAEELKCLCTFQIRNMTSEEILLIISGKKTSNTPGESESTEKSKNSSTSGDTKPSDTPGEVEFTEKSKISSTSEDDTKPSDTSGESESTDKRRRAGAFRSESRFLSTSVSETGARSQSLLLRLFS